jgi:hypothetical protein
VRVERKEEKWKEEKRKRRGGGWDLVEISWWLNRSLRYTWCNKRGKLFCFLKSGGWASLGHSRCWKSRATKHTCQTREKVEKPPLLSIITGIEQDHRVQTPSGLSIFRGRSLFSDFYASSSNSIPS